jgi:hypothetical protein
VGSKHKLGIEDGHNELKTGFTTTDAGAPEWGNFDFTIDIEKKEESSTLTLILFEESAKTVAEIMNYQYH